MKALLIEFTVSVAALMLTFLVGAAWGTHKANDHWQAQKAEAVQQLHDRYVGEVASANVAAAQSLSNQRELEARYAELDQRFLALRKRVPLVVPLSRDGASAHGAVCAGGVQQSANSASAAGGQVPGGQLLPAPDTAASIDAVPALTLAAVRMWNSALVGADTAAGACRADGAAAGGDASDSQEPCAQSAGVDLDDAWRNHAINARACAIDRARYQDLIDYLLVRQLNLGGTGR